ncbi:Sorting nexin-17 [Paramuricea clavata]|uniref:Sorting nexin-17 n=2 Tax=Paramuricea clavata TaxID=317549 RepID=A0A6S7KQN3_PARCT|nr:Sorting nexin-17 [Paramuricea clavata]
MDFPESNSNVIINIGGYELNFKLIGTQSTKSKEGSFKVTRIRCWRVVSSRDNDGEIVTKIAFEYLFTKDKLQWITITSDQAMLMSLCLQGMVDEIVQQRSKMKPKKSEAPEPKEQASPASAKEQSTTTAKEQSTTTAKKDVEKEKKQDSQSSDEGGAEKSSDKPSTDSPSTKRSSKKKKSKKIASVKNEVFAQDIKDEDL